MHRRSCKSAEGKNDATIKARLKLTRLKLTDGNINFSRLVDTAYLFNDRCPFGPKKIFPNRQNIFKTYLFDFKFHRNILLELIESIHLEREIIFLMAREIVH